MVLSVLAFTSELNVSQIAIAREISAAVVNVSGRQRMLSQRTALFSLRLVCSQDKVEREKLRSQLTIAIDLMENSHNGLIDGDLEMKLPGNPSKVVKAMYFEPPLHLDGQIRKFIAQVRALAEVEDGDLNQHNPHLLYILDFADGGLLDALDAIVSQYQKESEAEQLELDLNQIQLYKQSCAATAAAQAQAQQLEKALHDLQQERIKLIHTERISSLGQLVAGVAHEINNPINFIYGNLTYANNYVEDLIKLLHLYQKEYPNPNPSIEKKIIDIDLDFLIQDLPKVLSSMKIGADRIRQIVLSLRTFSRMDEKEMKPVDIHEGIESTLLILHSRLKSKDDRPEIKIIKEYGNLPLVQCHVGQLNQVLMNLLSNAIDALEMGTGDCSIPNPKSQIPNPQILIRTEALHPDYINVRIADNGPGITEEVKARLFDPFFTTKPVGKGTGLGLSISHQIVVEKHGGSLLCVSEPGQGTEFWIEIPIRQKSLVICY
ncbi:ATP-binding protein [Argonema antarcticum]|uniref:ATP-binding protein n=1 Tax=Argonema antarcticum TaxID=2942763 RepID=UPI00201298A0|nr:ATP-binding protein [Argonema antarcticum]MCL1469468.1 type IV pili methyl-accepting chemotaxis transducer N-terminal domain-containing protein [Argonema antarcticum A004/B2]